MRRLPDLTTIVTQPGDRVSVWMGKKREFAGLGQYKGRVTTYAIATVGEFWQSLTNIEELPSDEKIAEIKGELAVAQDIPKIQLDDGSVVYGHQTRLWWYPLFVDPN